MNVLIKALSLLLLLCSGCGGQDPAYTEYFPAPDGDKPLMFEFGHVEVCEVEQSILPAFLDGVDKFAQSRWLLKHRISEPGERVIALYTRGAPMRLHLMVEHLGPTHYRVAISSLKGAGCEEVCDAARAHSFCVTATPSSNSLKPTR